MIENHASTDPYEVTEYTNPLHWSKTVFQLCVGAVVKIGIALQE